MLDAVRDEVPEHGVQQLVAVDGTLAVGNVGVHASVRERALDARDLVPEDVGDVDGRRAPVPGELPDDATDVLYLRDLLAGDLEVFLDFRVSGPSTREVESAPEDVHDVRDVVADEVVQQRGALPVGLDAVDVAVQTRSHPAQRRAEPAGQRLLECGRVEVVVGQRLGLRGDHCEVVLHRREPLDELPDLVALARRRRVAVEVALRDARGRGLQVRDRLDEVPFDDQHGVRERQRRPQQEDRGGRNSHSAREVQRHCDLRDRHRELDADRHQYLRADGAGDADGVHRPPDERLVASPEPVQHAARAGVGLSHL